MFDTITKKQAGVIYGAWKRGEIEATKEQIDMMYFRYVSDNSVPTTDAKGADIALKLKNVVDSIFAKDGKANDCFAQFIYACKSSYDDMIFAI